MIPAADHAEQLDRTNVHDAARWATEEALGHILGPARAATFHDHIEQTFGYDAVRRMWQTTARAWALSLPGAAAVVAVRLTEHPGADGRRALRFEAVAESTTPAAVRRSAAYQLDQPFVLARVEPADPASVAARRGIARTVAQVLSDEVRVDAAALFRQLYRSGRNTGSVRALEGAFRDGQGGSLVEELADARRAGRLAPIQFEQALGLLGYRELPREVVITSTAVAVRADPAGLAPVRRVAHDLRRHIQAGQFDAAQALLAGLDRDPRKIWAVSDSYRRSFGSELDTDLLTRSPADRHAYLNLLLGDINPDPVPEHIAARWFEQLATVTFDHLATGAVPVTAGHPEDGCFFRAHLWGLRLAQLGANVRKIFVARADPDLSVWSATAAGATEVNPRQVNWTVHVAPVVEVAYSDGHLGLAVFDPALMPGMAVTDAAWIAATGVTEQYRFLEGDLDTVTEQVRKHFERNPNEWEHVNGRWVPREAVVVVTDPHAVILPAPGQLGAA